MKEGEHRLLRAVVERARAAAGLQRGLRPAGVDRAPLAALARPRPLPRPSVAHVPAAQRPDAEGPDLRAHRRAAGGGHDVAARDPPGRAQLGLPLQLDPRLDVHAVGAVLARLRLGGQRLLLLHRRRRRRRGGPPGHVRRRRRAPARRAHPRSPRGLRGRAAGPDRQRRLRAAASTTCGARCSTRSTCTPAPATRWTSGCGRSSSARSSRRSRTGASPTAASGRSAASPSTSPRPRCSAGWRATAAPGWPSCARTSRARGAGARPPTRSRPTSWSTASTSAACSSSTTTPTRSTPRCC